MQSWQSLKMDRENYTSGAKWEDIVGYSRAVKMGNIIEVAGTTSVVDGKIVGKDNAYIQTKTIIEIAEKVLREAGASLADVVRTRMYTTDITLWEQIGKAHGEAFREVKPATTLVGISKLIDPEMLIEIEFTAILNKS